MSWDDLIAALPHLLPLVGGVLALAVLVRVVDRVAFHRGGSLAERPGLRYSVLIGITVVGLLVLGLFIPDETTKKGLLTLVGLLVSAILALSSTTFVSNAMAGLLVRSVRSYRPGDFVRIREDFGRVTEIGLFHTEIQTEDRDLTTLPNLYVISNPVTVLRASGTIVSAELSLGYDLDHRRIEELLVAAAEKAELEEPFVHVTGLGDYAVGYRVAGFLREVKRILTVRSNLRRSILDTLHGAGVEILSPAWMAQRPTRPERPVIPNSSSAAREVAGDRSAAESLAFDKADVAEKREGLEEERAALVIDIAATEKELGKLDAEGHALLSGALERKKERLARMEARIETLARAEKDMR